ncbi:MAG: hypothetical protein M5R36_04095 [Deltaproteobacteria bacterium]|nr:hypothetical protein [Deltaproteobacteria bacterium]
MDSEQVSAAARISGFLYYLELALVLPAGGLLLIVLCDAVIHTGSIPVFDGHKRALALIALGITIILPSLRAILNRVARGMDKRKKTGPIIPVASATKVTWFIFSIGIVTIPNCLQINPKRTDSNAHSAGHNAQMAEEIHFETNGNRGYANSLRELMKFDKNLTEDLLVTFVFGNVNAAGYTFTTTHERGSEAYTWTHESWVEAEKEKRSLTERRWRARGESTK